MRKWIQVLLLASTGTLLMSGCYSHRGGVVREETTVVYHHPAGEAVVVTEPPPAPRTEYRGVAPDDRHVWVAGYWSRSGARWVWVPGHWEARPRYNAIWVPGHWDKTPDERGWTWTAGHWE